MIHSELRRLAVSFIEGGIKLPLIVVGAMGIGKSQLFQQLAAEYGYEYFDFRGATQEAGDLTGNPITKDLRTMWAAPGWIPAPDKKLMLILEEVNRAPLDVRQAVFQLMTEYKIHMNALPKNTFIAVCINPPGDYQVEDLDIAMFNRGLRVDLDVDVNIWMSYATEKKFDPRVIEFIGNYPDMLQKVSTEGQCPTCRSWENVSKVLAVIPDDLRIQAVRGLVGNAAAVAFGKFIANEMKRCVNGDEILHDYAKVKARLEKQTNDMTSQTISLLKLAIEKEVNLSKKEIANLVAFLKGLPQEMQQLGLGAVPNKYWGELGDLCDAIASSRQDLASLKATGKLKSI